MGYLDDDEGPHPMTLATLDGSSMGDAREVEVQNRPDPPHPTPSQALEAIDRAWREVLRLCRGPRRWTMSVPVDQERDSDMVIGDALTAARRAIEDAPGVASVLQDWVMRLPLREQGTLLSMIRGCDDEPKAWTATGFSDSPGRRLTAWLRWTFLHPADPREVDIPGAFLQSTPPDPFRPSEFGHLPLHWYTHAMHALEVVAYRHPDPAVVARATAMYVRMVDGLHLTIESRPRMIERLSEDRIETGTVVS